MQGTKWEYKTLKIEPDNGWSELLTGGAVNAEAADAQMNRLGQEGWELVSALDTNEQEGRTRFVLLVFKRPL